MGDQRTNLLLVGEVEKHPILYNFHLPGYSKKHETEEAWNEVGDVVKLTAAECKQRWKNIRAVFCRHMKPHKSGSGTKEKKAYYLADALQFTVPYIKALGKPSVNLSQPRQEEEHLAIRDESIIDDEDYIPSETPSTSPSPLSPPSSSPTVAFPQHQVIQSKPMEYRIPKNKHVAKVNEVDKAFVVYLKHKKATSSTKDVQLTRDPREEPLKMFLLSMIPDLLKMDDREVRQFKRKTLDTVDEILSAKSTCPASSCPSTSNSIS